MRRGLTVLAVLAGVAPALAAARERVVLVPFENVPRLATAEAVVMKAVGGELLARGYDVVYGAKVEELLEARRIRYLDALTAPQRRELLEKLEASGLVVGSILAYAREGEPYVALAARLVGADGSVRWSDVRGLSARGTAGAFRRGAVDGTDDAARRAVAERAVAEMLASAPPGDPSARPAARRSSPSLRAARAFRSERLRGTALRICVLPLQDWTGRRDVARVVEAVLQDQLLRRASVTLVDPADTRQAVVQQRVLSPSRASLDALRALVERVGTSLFLRGEILGYSAGVAGASPEVELYLNLVDAKTGEVLWSGIHRRTGRDYERLLQLGAVHDPVSLASAAAGELVAAFTSY